MRSSRTGRPQRPRRRQWLVSDRAMTYSLLLLLAVVWEVVATLGVIDSTFTSKPTQVVSALFDMSQDAAVRVALIETFYALAVAFLVGAGLGLIVGLILGLNRLLRDAYLPFVVLLLGVPKSVFLPLFTLFFGLGLLPGIAFGVLLASIQVVINVVGGIDSIDKIHYQMAKAYGASPWHLFSKVILPGAAPGIFAGMWHGIRNAFIGVVIAQLFVSNVGVGYLVRIYTNNFQIDKSLALIFFVAVIVILAGVAWETLERRLSRWRAPISFAAATPI